MPKLKLLDVSTNRMYFLLLNCIEKRKNNLIIGIISGIGELKVSLR